MIKTDLREPGGRIEILDVLRGFALAGIFYAHMIFWYTGAALPSKVYFAYDNFIDTVAIAIFGAFIFGKFFSIFSFLFGLGFYLHFIRYRSKQKTGYLKFYVWRLILLFVIGLLHHIFWRGDILTIYALLGMCLTLFRDVPDRIVLALALLLITNLPTHIYELLVNSNSLDPRIDFPMAAEARDYYFTINNADLLSTLKANWNSWPSKIYYQMESGRFMMTFGYFLLGLYAGKKQFFNAFHTYYYSFKHWNSVTRGAVFLFLLLGLLMYLMNFVSLPELIIIPELQWLASILFSIYNVCLSIYFITGISLLCKHKTYSKVLKPLAGMGKMALTNYLLQTLFGLSLFYQFGLGLFNKTSPIINILLAASIFYLQLKFSQVWLAYFKQGPVEWLWKSLSHIQFTSNRRSFT